MVKMKQTVVVLLLAAWFGVLPAMAQDTPADAETVEGPPGTEPLDPNEPLEADVTIREERGKKIYEYRRAGKLVMVRVQPVVGPPYYFYDQNGDGTLEYHRDDPRSAAPMNQWIIHSW